MTEEIIKTLNYKGNEYRVSNLGRVWLKDKELRIRKNADDYLVVTTKDYGCEYRSTGVHRLVAMAFVENDAPETKVEVNHKDYNRQNNDSANLEWVTHADNVRYSVCNKPDLTGERNPNYGNKKLSKFYAENPNVAIAKQGRKGLKNGRCRKISMYRDNELVGTFNYIVDCCKYLCSVGIANTQNIESVRGCINKSVRNDIPYKGYKFVKE